MVSWDVTDWSRTRNLAEAFTKDMLDGAKRCKAELGYNPSYWTRSGIR